MRIVGIIQARMGSARLPGKVLVDLAGEAMLVRVINRMLQARTLDEIVVATTVHARDDVIVELCAQRYCPVFRGSEHDVLDRYYQAAVTHAADVIVRITSDCPLIDPVIVDQMVREFVARQPTVDYVCNVLPRRTFPRGLDTEVFRFDVLKRAWREDDSPASREHVTPYIYDNPDSFTGHGFTSTDDYSHMRWTVDTPADAEFVRLIYDHFGHDRFSWREVTALLREHSDWLEINRDVRQKTI